MIWYTKMGQQIDIDIHHSLKFVSYFTLIFRHQTVGTTLGDEGEIRLAESSWSAGSYLGGNFFK